MNEQEFNDVNENYFEKLRDDTAMRTHVWGPPFWFYLHCMAMAYPKKINENKPEHIRKKDSMFAFLSNLGTILPCGICSASYNQYIKEPFYNINKYLDSRAQLARFIYLLHERVNEKLGVAQCYRPSFKKIIKKYGKFIVGLDQCKVTDLEQQTKNSLKGCGENNNSKQKYNMDFKKYKTIVSVIDKDTKKVEDFDIKEEIEQFGNINIGGNANISGILSITLIVILSIVVAVLIYLRSINK
jgi:hypothetical protein